MHAEGERKQAENNQEGAIQTYRTMSPTPAVPLVVAAPKASSNLPANTIPTANFLFLC